MLPGMNMSGRGRVNLPGDAKEAIHITPSAALCAAAYAGTRAGRRHTQHYITPITCMTSSRLERIRLRRRADDDYHSTYDTIMLRQILGLSPHFRFTAHA